MKTTKQTDAQRFACKFFRCRLDHLDGSKFNQGKRDWAQALFLRCGGYESEYQGDCDRPRKYRFRDGSSIITCGEGWDFGLPNSEDDCYCWEGSYNGRHERSCPALERYDVAWDMAKRLSAIPDCRAKALDDGRVAIYDDATQAWCAVDVDDAEELADRLDDCECVGDEYALWCSETDSEVVEVEL